MAKILVVDDARFMRMMLSGILSEDGHEVVGQGENAKMAIEQYSSLKPDIMTLDIIMPEIDGINSVHAIKEILAHDQNAKIIVVSAMGQKDIMVECLQAGVKDFIVKPFQPEKVKATVQRILAK